MIGGSGVRKSTIIVEIPANVKVIWDIVTDNKNTTWRSDLSKVEVIDDKEFVEYTNKGVATKFTIEAKNPYEYYSFSFGNENMQGLWHGKFESINDNLTKLEFVEEITIKNKVLELLSILFFPIKKMQKQYMRDLQMEISKR